VPITYAHISPIRRVFRQTKMTLKVSPFDVTKGRTYGRQPKQFHRQTWTQI
jgi:hypothetical protein